MRKKISLFIPSFDIGGVERVMITLANHLAGLGNEVSLVVTRDKGDLRPEIDAAVSVVDLGDIQLRKALLPLMRYLKKNKPDYLFSGPDFPNIMALLAKSLVKVDTRVIITQHNFFDASVQKLGMHGRIFPFLAKCLYPKAYRIVAVSEGVKGMLRGWGIPEEKLKRIYNPMDLRNIRALANEDPGLELPENFIVYVGRLNLIKNLTLLLDAMVQLRRSHPDLKLLVLGGGEEMEALKQYCQKKELESHVIFFGNSQNPFPVLKRARILVLPSRSESFGNVLVEAMALGVTSVATPTPGAKEVSENGKSAYLVNTFTDPVEIAAKIDYACRYPLRKYSLYKRALAFNAAEIIKEYTGLIS